MRSLREAAKELGLDLFDLVRSVNAQQIGYQQQTSPQQPTGKVFFSDDDLLHYLAREQQPVIEEQLGAQLGEAIAVVEEELAVPLVEKREPIREEYFYDYLTTILGFDENRARKVSSPETVPVDELEKRITALDTIFNNADNSHLGIVSCLFQSNPEDLLHANFNFQKYSKLLKAAVQAVHQNYPGELPEEFDYVRHPGTFSTINGLREINQKLRATKGTAARINDENVQGSLPTSGVYPETIAAIRAKGIDYEMMDLIITKGFRPQGIFKPFGDNFIPEIYLKDNVAKYYSGGLDRKLSSRYNRTLKRLVKEGVVLKSPGRKQGECYALNPSSGSVDSCLLPYLLKAYGYEITEWTRNSDDGFDEHRFDDGSSSNHFSDSSAISSVISSIVPETVVNGEINGKLKKNGF